MNRYRAERGAGDSGEDHRGAKVKRRVNRLEMMRGVNQERGKGMV